MQQFIAKYQDQIQGVISGFDRLVLRGSLRRITFQRGMEEYLWQNHVLFKDYQQHVKKNQRKGERGSGGCLSSEEASGDLFAPQ